MSFRDVLGKKLIFFDGAMGTMLQAAGLKGGDVPEYWNFDHSDEVLDIHYKYLMAGANVVETNAFGANPITMPQDTYSSYDVMVKSVNLCKEAIEKCKKETGRDDMFVAAGLGPIGKLLEPLGQVTFDEAYEGFKVLVKAAEDAGADFILIETMTDIYEVKAAVLAVKENSNLPVVASVMLDEKGKLLTGADIEVVATVLEGLNVDGVGLNCGFGPAQMKPFVEKYLETTSLPLMVNPNAGMPITDEEGNTTWPLGPDEFAEIVAGFGESGAFMIGGCCGTSPEFIAKLVDKAKDIVPPAITKKEKTIVTSYSLAHQLKFRDSFTIIGEKINPTGNKVFKVALKSGDTATAIRLAKDQQLAGADVIDVNAGLPEIDEVETLAETVKSIQAVVNAPLMIDTADAAAMEKACRYYNGAPFINSVSGKQSSMDKIFPIAAKYGGVLIALTLDDEGIPETSEGRLHVALKIIKEAEKYGISKNRIVVDPLTLTLSASKDAVKVTVMTVRKLRQLGIKTSLGISNISFGLPNRDVITAGFLQMVLSAGLDAAIMNPFSETIMNTYYGYCALNGNDPNFEKYIAFAEKHKSANLNITRVNQKNSLDEAIVNGLKAEAKTATTKLGKDTDPIDIINDHVIPALDKVGAKYESGEIYLPQLLMSAEAAHEAFTVIKGLIEAIGVGTDVSKGKIIIATVKGDIHDIGKNIVKVLLENYGYDVIDLGKDVDPDLIVETAKKEDIKLVGLSALMTTTVPSMEETIKKLRAENIDCKVIVGGAVLNEQYAEMIGADSYCKDATATVKYAEKFFGN